MKIENSIGWTDCTINAVTGCDKVSAGCRNCYASVGTRARVLRAQGIETWGANGQRFPVNFKPTFRRLNKLSICDVCHESYEFFPQIFEHTLTHGICEECGGKVRRIRLFADSNSDWLDKKWPVDTLAEFLISILSAENVDVQLLTKRPENFFTRLSEVIDAWSHLPDFSAEMLDKIQAWIDGEPPKNVWIGVSVENQEMADLRIPLLLKIPAKIRFLSCEPLLEKIDWGYETVNWNESKDGKIDWIIVGGESGKNRRDCGLEAIVSVAEHCLLAKVPVFVKQDCSFKSGVQGRIPDAIWSLKQMPISS